jgi:hypothetical protein
MSQGEPASAELIAALARFVQKFEKSGGVTAAAKELVLSRLTITSVLAGLEVRRGTLAQLREKLGVREA